jgi:hypothetical protein
MAQLTVLMVAWAYPNSPMLLKVSREILIVPVPYFTHKVQPLATVPPNAEFLGEDQAHAPIQLLTM